MKIITVETKEQLKELYDAWAMTWEGLREEDFEVALKECGQENADGYLIKGSVMNKICKLTEDNAYPDDLNIFSIAFQFLPTICPSIINTRFHIAEPSNV